MASDVLDCKQNGEATFSRKHNPKYTHSYTKH